MSTQDQQACRFDHFMQHALHDPKTGYYSQNIRTIGASGDFSTTATLSNVLGKAIAQTSLNWQHEHNTPLNLIEIGGGDGSLASSIIKSIPFFKRLKLSYHLVDNSTPLSKKQHSKLGRKVILQSDIISALQACKGVAFIFSNELVDAFPVRVFKHSNNSSEWKELFIKGHQEVFENEPNELPESSAFTNYSYSPEQRIEIHESYQNWLKSWVPHWKFGQMLTIDYGDIHPDIYYRMPKGTLRAYAHHQRLTGPQVYMNPGRQDITADVNFTDLIEWGNQENLTTLSIETQEHFLNPYINDSPEDQFLVNSVGAGVAFKVLLQQRDA